MSPLLLTIDVAHPPRPPDRVEAELLDAWEAVEAIAQQLMQTPHLSARQVRCIMRAVGH